MTDGEVAGKASSRGAIVPGLARDLRGDIERITRRSLEAGPVGGLELPMCQIARGH